MKTMAEGDEGTTIVDTYKRRGACNFNVRIPNALANNIDELIDEGEFKNRSEFVVTAVRQYLEHVHSKKNTNRLILSIDSNEASPRVQEKS